MNGLTGNVPEHYDDLVEQGSVNAARKLIASLYDPKAKARTFHGSLNELLSKETSLANLPPFESSSLCHVRRAL
jgi:hypothetical protein